MGTIIASSSNLEACAIRHTGQDAGVFAVGFAMPAAEGVQ